MKFISKFPVADADSLESPQKFEGFFLDYYPRVKGFINGLLQDAEEAEDLSQDKNTLFCHKICNLHKFLWRGVRPPPGSDDKVQSRKVRTSDEISAIPYTPKPAGFPYSFCFFL